MSSKPGEEQTERETMDVDTVTFEFASGSQDWSVPRIDETNLERLYKAPIERLID